MPVFDHFYNILKVQCLGSLGEGVSPHHTQYIHTTHITGAQLQGQTDALKSLLLYIIVMH